VEPTYPDYPLGGLNLNLTKPTLLKIRFGIVH